MEQPITPLTREELALEQKITDELNAGRLDVLSMPQVVVKVLALLGDEDVEITDIAEEVGNDQGLATHILALANSAFYRGSAQIQSIEQAVIRLGLREIKGVVLMISLKNVFKSNSHPKLAQALWQHSLATALVSKRLCELTGGDGEDAFTAGLVHDIGKAVVLALYEKLIAQNELDEVSEDTLARVVDEFHVETGRLLAKEWELPQVASEAIVAHHCDVREGQHSREVALVALANRLAAIMGYISPGADTELQDTEELCRHLGVDAEIQISLINETPEIVSSLEAITS